MYQRKEEKKNQGIKKCIVQKSIRFDHYQNCFFLKKEQMRKMNVAGSLAHGVFREEVNNIALNAYDDDE